MIIFRRTAFVDHDAASVANRPLDSTAVRLVLQDVVP